MQLIVIHEFGGPEVLVPLEVPVPIPAAGEVRVAVHAVSVNPVDTKWRQGGPLTGFPVGLGWDVSGVVDALGPDVAAFAVGDEVFGLIRFPAEARAYAPWVTAPVTHLARKPAAMSHVQAAATTLAPLTAHQAFEKMNLTAGQTVLIHAAAGGVGHFAVQLAKTRGAHVIATSSGPNLDFVRSLGADDVMDYTARPFEEQVSEVDAVLDTVGGDTLTRSVGVVREDGWLVTIAGQAPTERAEERGVHAERILVHPSQEGLDFLAAEFTAGRLTPHISQTFPLAQVADAHRALETRHTVGKIVLELAK
ncbi:NADP-dependent oxidoreductase [Deinococcus sp.]|uniref:NADP-dependent oxidoreductase n=1 Tax=Deinococcus sp. TaxID=47478 RepID=UPI002869C115|nr:NADP-dependent oxidoreductase [Deinococcus sp.]